MGIIRQTGGGIYAGVTVVLIAMWAMEHFLVATTMLVVGLFAVIGWDSMFPDRRDALTAWAHKAAWGRIIGGVHYPSDDVGGQVLARALLAEFEKNPAFRAALERAKAEAAPFLLPQAA